MAKSTAKKTGPLRKKAAPKKDASPHFILIDDETDDNIGVEMLGRAVLDLKGVNEALDQWLSDENHDGDARDHIMERVRLFTVKPMTYSVEVETKVNLYALTTVAD